MFMIPSLSHLRIVVLTAKTAFALALTVVITVIGYIVTQFDGNAEFPVDCAVVFGAAVHGKGTAGPGITRRVTTASDLYHDGKVQRLFFTGGIGDIDKESEAHVMRKVALLQGVDPEDITLEEEASSTIENIVFTQPLLEDCESIVGISDRYHLARIGFFADMYNVPLQTHPSDTLSTKAFEVRSVLREGVALLYAFILRFRLAGSLLIVSL